MTKRVRLRPYTLLSWHYLCTVLVQTVWLTKSLQFNCRGPLFIPVRSLFFIQCDNLAQLIILKKKTQLISITTMQLWCRKCIEPLIKRGEGALHVLCTLNTPEKLCIFPTLLFRPPFVSLCFLTVHLNSSCKQSSKSLPCRIVRLMRW